MILKFEEMCLESAKEYAPLFVQVLNILYDEDIIQEDVILEWANHKEHAADESDKIFVKQSQKFIQGQQNIYLFTLRSVSFVVFNGTQTINFLSHIERHGTGI